MARLNDPPPPVESVENLKRRFTRQNRDIVRNNSAQAIRIRNLETEVARLLAENLSLRQALITESEEVSRLKRRDFVSGELLALKSDLEQKLAQVSGIVAELGRLPERVRSKEQAVRRLTVAEEPSSTPTKELWERRRMMMPSFADQDGHLPAIVEGKSFPRLTLDPTDIQCFSETGSGAPAESPDLGPPPVSHFEAADAMESTPNETAAGEEDSTDPTTTVNVERRRKRRTSSLISDMEVTNHQAHDHADSDTASATETSRPSSKRKFDASELQPTTKSAVESRAEQETFVYQRKPALKPASAARKSSRFTRPSDRQNSQSASHHISSPEKERKALAPKNVNSPTKKVLEAKPSAKGSTEPASPVKRLDSSLSSRRRREQKSSTTTERPPTRGKSLTEHVSTDSLSDRQTQVSVLAEPDTDSHSDHVHEVDVLPKTPLLPDDILSPPSSQPSGPSNTRALKEAVIMNSVEDVLNGSIGRASRRAKAAVSYAEPNLRDKMRRPGKEFVGAVEGYDRKKRDGSLGLDEQQAQSTFAETGLSSQQPRWSNSGAHIEEPRSPLREKQAANERRRRETIDIQTWAQGEPQPSLREADSGFAPLENSIHGLSIFDHPVSSPSHPDNSNNASVIEVQPPSSNSATVRRKTGSRLSTSSSTPSLSSGTSTAGRRHSLQPSSSASSKAVSDRVALKCTASRQASAASIYRPSSATGDRTDAAQERSRDRDSSKSSAVLKRASSAALLSHRRTASDVSRRSTSFTSVDSNVSNSDVESGSDYEPTHLSGAGDGTDASAIRPTRRRSMMV
ncbi:uncharacterized protein HMPREF1541_02770 [Cyphellophora europaea CBS 101466]|uniref:Shugoshin C-terminal domain-containing protein n=1 Tax=Cyphellophora europaea (strain CBS 101466) TaxID=1220924 RepID=W2S4I0_CYPE1|nr:uncharacterized protein HMPREF1541_02770 [Cyphellophora europaea CBS 101466]ETN43611.1 hypothetical protein HMPREF1541_02770 [Cyphellophora europaea CBS 101466]